jgi:hypothetical protein
MPVTPQIQLLARQIIDRETAGRETPADVAQGLEGAFQRLYQLMSTLVGHVGFGAVMSRAVHLTNAGRPTLGVELQVTKAGAIMGLPEHIEREGAAHAVAYAADLLANVIALLCDFIGEHLTFRLVARIWTDLPGGHAGPRGDQGS